VKKTNAISKREECPSVRAREAVRPASNGNVYRLPATDAAPIRVRACPPSCRAARRLPVRAARERCGSDMLRANEVSLALISHASARMSCPNRRPTDSRRLGDILRLLYRLGA